MDLSTIPMNDIGALIQWLDEMFPNQCPLEKDTERQIWIKVGQRKAAEIIQSKLKLMQRKELGDK